MAGQGAAAPAWLREDGGAVTLELLIQPRASRTRAVGEHDGRLKVQLAAPPVDGEANAALVEFLARALGVKKGAVELLRGDTGRRKTVRVAGVAAAAALRALGGPGRFE
jgi:uncharacterized protein (TIGR00251 family)